MREPLTRRVFLHRFGMTTLAIAAFGVSACSEERLGTVDPTTTSSTGPPVGPEDPAGSPTSTSEPNSSSETTAPLVGVDYRRVDLGNVSAYILARSGRATIVDTGNPGSAPDIEAGLTALDLSWEDVEHLVLTHRHGDHIGSVDAVLSAAVNATAYAGELDIPQIGSPRPLVAVGDGDEVFGLQIIDTPGHTAGHISVLDPVGGVLVAGDSLNGRSGGVTGPNPSFTADMATANLSVKKMAGLSFNTLLFGHGGPVEGGADVALRELAAGL